MAFTHNPSVTAWAASDRIGDCRQGHRLPGAMIAPHLSEIRELAGAALAAGEPTDRVAERLAEQIAACDEDGRYDLVDALEGARDPWIPPLLRRLVASDPSHHVKELALEQLAEHPSAETHRFLLGLLPEGTAWNLTRTAARLLAGYPSDETVDALVPLLDYFDVYTREAAVSSLARLARPRIAGLLHAIQRTGLEEGTVKEAIRALGMAPEPPERDPLLQALIAKSEAEIVDPDPEVRARALERLVFVGPADLADRLLAHLGDPDEGARETAAFHLGPCRDPRIVPALFDLVRGDSSMEVRAGALRALWHHRSPEVLDFLLEQASRPEIRGSGSALCDLVLALGDYDDERAIDALVDVMLDRELNVMARNTAADRLIKHNRPRLEPAWESIAHEDNAAGSIAREALQDLAQHGAPPRGGRAARP